MSEKTYSVIKWGVFLIALLLSLSVNAQEIFTMKMDVLENEEKFSKETKDTVVVWGAKEDTTCFFFNNKTRCFFSVQDSIWRRLDKEEQDNILYFLEKEKSTSKLILLTQNIYNELFILRIRYNGNGISFFVTSIEGVPNYTFNSIQIPEELR